MDLEVATNQVNNPLTLRGLPSFHLLTPIRDQKVLVGLALHPRTASMPMLGNYTFQCGDEGYPLFVARIHFSGFSDKHPVSQLICSAFRQFSTCLN